ncbi:MAG: nicotinamide riboside transporter PnuC [Alphaproteobacteria bacterium]|nr:nicotinamide riboside transporter PnuC [Alphaproteobacteria bacterium]
MNFLRKNFDLLVFPYLILALAVMSYFFGSVKIPILELCAVLSLVISRPLQKRELPSGLAIAAIGNALLALYFTGLGLTGQVILSLFLVTMNFIALYSWIRPVKKKGKIIRPTFLSPLPRIGIAFAVIFAAAFGITANGTIGALDYFSMAAGVIGILLLARKKIEVWALFIITDIAGIFLFWLAGSYLMLAAVFMFGCNDTAALFRWWKVFRKINKKKL